MSDHDAERLAQQLDQLLNNPASGDDPLLSAASRLANAPKPRMRPEALARVKMQVLQAQPQPFPYPVALAGGAAAAVVLVLVVVLSSFNPPPSILATDEPSAEAATEQIIVNTDEAVVVTDEATPTESKTATPSFTPSAAATAEPTLTPAAIIVVEGEVEAVTANTIIVFGVVIQIPPDNALLSAIQIGDQVRLEVDTLTGEMIAVDVEVVGVEIYVNEDSGEVFRDDSSCANPPPDWAPAIGWRRRCQPDQGSGSSNQGNNGNGNGNGNGNNGNGNNGNGNGGGRPNDDD